MLLIAVVFEIKNNWSNLLAARLLTDIFQTYY